jgi:hypothetical protein
MKKFYAIFASLVLFTTTAIARVSIEDEGGWKVMRRLQAATTFAGGGAFHAGYNPIDEEKFQAKRTALMGDTEEKEDDKTPAAVFETADALEMHGDLVYGLQQVSGTLGKLGFVSAEASTLAALAEALEQALNSSFEDGAGKLVTAGTVAAAMYLAERGTAADIAGGVTAAARWTIGSEEGFKNKALRKAAGKFAVRFGEIVETKAKRAGSLILRWVLGHEIVDDSTVLGRAYLKARSAIVDVVDSATQTAKGFARKAATWAGRMYVGAKRLFGYKKAEVTAIA